MKMSWTLAEQYQREEARKAGNDSWEPMEDGRCVIAWQWDEPSHSYFWCVTFWGRERIRTAVSSSFAGAARAAHHFAQEEWYDPDPAAAARHWNMPAPKSEEKAA